VGLARTPLVNWCFGVTKPAQKFGTERLRPHQWWHGSSGLAAWRANDPVLADCLLFSYAVRARTPIDGPPKTMKSKNELLAKKKQIKRKSAKAKHNRVIGIHKPDAAGADIGATEIYIAVPPERVENNVRCFGTFTADLRALVQWLKDCAVTSVAMESTGVYWIPLYELLEQEGFEVYLVNARHVKNVPGRKSDVQDCQWLQYLHSVGLLRASYRPVQEICAMRTISRYRDNLSRFGVQHLKHMQAALDQMNVRLHHVIADLSGNTGMAIVEAILAGTPRRNHLQCRSFLADRRDHKGTCRNRLRGRVRDRGRLGGTQRPHNSRHPSMPFFCILALSVQWGKEKDESCAKKSKTPD
jgi:Transposase